MKKKKLYQIYKTDFKLAKKVVFLYQIEEILFSLNKCKIFQLC